MPTHSKIVRGAATFAFLFALTLTAAHPALAQTESVLYYFCSQQSCADGENPWGGLIIDGKGNLYGTTFNGGSSQGGVMFELSPTGSETVLINFTDVPNTGGYGPVSGLARDFGGNLYGTTTGGGAYNDGVVFKKSPNGAETVLHSFGAPGDGSVPYSAVIRDAQGNLYGTTVYGGADVWGTVYKINTDGTESILHSFAETTSDGGMPEGGLVFDKQGNLYGTTFQGGAYGLGTVFKISPDGTETVLHSFGNASDGQNPLGTLVFGQNGELYGATYGGGAYRYGTVFKLSLSGREWVLHSFSAKNGDGFTPIGGLAVDAVGNLYGATSYGGASGWGTVFEIATDGTETLVYSFAGGTADGEYPFSGPVMDSAGNIYGTTSSGGIDGQSGVVYKITP